MSPLKELHFRPCDEQDAAQIFRVTPRFGGFEIKAGDSDYCLATRLDTMGEPWRTNDDLRGQLTKINQQAMVFVFLMERIQGV